MDYQSAIFKFFGGLALFLYGMNLMSDGLKKIGSKSFERILRSLTQNRLIAVLVGLVITCLIQSSSATSVMVVGFVNAGLLTFEQAVAVVLGADVGTTITAWIVSALGVGKFKLAAFSFPIIAVGFLVQFFAKRRKIKTIGQSLLGFGLLFLGLGTISEGVEPIKQSVWVKESFSTCEQIPLLGILIGTFVTMIIQSSSATIAIVQVMAAQGILGLDAALPLMLGDNIGTTITAQLAAIGGTRSARGVAMANTLFKIFGTAFCVPLLLTGLFQEGIRLIISDGVVAENGINSAIMIQIAVAHTAFNIINTGLFSSILWPLLIKSAKRITFGTGSFELANKDIRYLDPLLLATPLFALLQCEKQLSYMIKLGKKITANAFEVFMTGNLKNKNEIEATEEVIDGLQEQTTSFLVQLSRSELSYEVSAAIPRLIHCINDAERIGDHAENLVELTELRLNNKIAYSERAEGDLRSYFSLVSEQFEAVRYALDNKDREAVSRAMAIEEKLNEQHQTLSNRNVSRVEGERCLVLGGVVFFNLLTNLERIGDHLTNIAERVHLDSADDRVVYLNSIKKKPE